MRKSCLPSTYFYSLNKKTPSISFAKKQFFSFFIYSLESPVTSIISSISKPSFDRFLDLCEQFHPSRRNIVTGQHSNRQVEVVLFSPKIEILKSKPGKLLACNRGPFIFQYAIKYCIRCLPSGIRG